jgi:hypothetical protein
MEVLPNVMELFALKKVTVFLVHAIWAFVLVATMEATQQLISSVMALPALKTLIALPTPVYQAFA